MGVLRDPQETLKLPLTESPKKSVFGHISSNFEKFQNKLTVFTGSMVHLFIPRAICFKESFI